MADDLRTLTFDQFYAYVDRFISRRLGIGLESLADVDIWDWYTNEPCTVEFWRSQVKEAAQFVMENQDCVDGELLSLFE